MVQNKDKITKNNKDIDHKVSGIIPGNKKDMLYPVRSYKMYIEKINTNNPHNNIRRQCDHPKIMTPSSCLVDLAMV